MNSELEALTQAVQAHRHGIAVEVTSSPRLPWGAVFRRIGGDVHRFTLSTDGTGVSIHCRRRGLFTTGKLVLIVGLLVLAAGIGLTVLARVTPMTSGVIAAIGVAGTTCAIVCFLLSQCRATVRRRGDAVDLRVGLKAMQFRADEIAGVQIVGVPVLCDQESDEEGTGAMVAGAIGVAVLGVGLAATTGVGVVGTGGGDEELNPIEVHLVLSDGQRIAMNHTRRQGMARANANLLASTLGVPMEVCFRA